MRRSTWILLTRWLSEARLAVLHEIKDVKLSSGEELAALLHLAHELEVLRVELSAYEPPPAHN